MSALTAPPIPTFNLNARPVNLAFDFPDDSASTQKLVNKHRPSRLADMVGQGLALYKLELFLDFPVSQAFVFSGPTGTGKTTAALALANELGVDVGWNLHTFRSGENNKDAIERAFDLMRFAHSGWAVFVIEEADGMSPAAKDLWLSALEDSLPPRTVVIFTTNHVNKFEKRFLDRCEHVKFIADGTTLAQDAQYLIDRTWLAETGRDDSPRLADLPGVIDSDNEISFRRAVESLAPLLRQAKRVEPLKPPTPPVVTPALAPTPDPAPELSRSIPEPSMHFDPEPLVLRFPTAKRRKPKRETYTAKPSRVESSEDHQKAKRALAELDQEFEEIGFRLFELDRLKKQWSKRLKESKPSGRMTVGK